MWFWSWGRTAVTTEWNNMPEKPSYIGLLNAISVAESEAECYLNAWAAVTPNDDVRSILSTVAIREGEHGKAFQKRLCELGFALQPRESDAADKLDIASSRTLSDREKFEKLGVGRTVADRAGDNDVFLNMFRDTTLDIQTSALLGRYIAEERDSGRLLSGCYSELCRLEDGGSHTTVSASLAADLGDRLGRVESLLEQVCETLTARNEGNGLSASASGKRAKG
jgi:rubrerythrin